MLLAFSVAATQAPGKAPAESEWEHFQHGAMEWLQQKSLTESKKILNP